MRNFAVVLLLAFVVATLNGGAASAAKHNEVIKVQQRNFEALTFFLLNGELQLFLMQEQCELN